MGSEGGQEYHTRRFGEFLALGGSLGRSEDIFDVLIYAPEVQTRLPRTLLVKGHYISETGSPGGTTSHSG